MDLDVELPADEGDEGEEDSDDWQSCTSEDSDDMEVREWIEEDESLACAGLFRPLGRDMGIDPTSRQPVYHPQPPARHTPGLVPEGGAAAPLPINLDSASDGETDEDDEEEALPGVPWKREMISEC